MSQNLRCQSSSSIDFKRHGSLFKDAPVLMLYTTIPQKTRKLFIILIIRLLTRAQYAMCFSASGVTLTSLIGVSIVIIKIFVVVSYVVISRIIKNFALWYMHPHQNKLLTLSILPETQDF